MQEFMALRHIDALRKSRIEEPQQFPYVLVYMQSESQGVRFRIRKRKSVLKWKPSLQQDDAFWRPMTDRERNITHVPDGERQEPFKIFALTRK